LQGEACGGCIKRRFDRNRMRSEKCGGFANSGLTEEDTEFATDRKRSERGFETTALFRDE
jgi:hypothetical protein